MQRDHPRRVPLRVAVTVEPPRGPMIRGWARDLSVSGVFVEAAAKLPPGSRCTVTLALGQGTGRRDVRCDGTVARTDEAGMGIALQANDPDVTCELAREVMWGDAPTGPGSG